MSHSELLKRITVRPDVFGGKPIVRDMRLSVELILSLLAQGGHDGRNSGRLPETRGRRRPRVHRLRACGDRRRHAGLRLGDEIVKFLVDHCAGRRLAEWLRGRGHDVFAAGELESNPGDQALLKFAASEPRPAGAPLTVRGGRPTLNACPSGSKVWARSVRS